MSSLLSLRRKFGRTKEEEAGVVHRTAFSVAATATVSCCSWEGHQWAFPLGVLSLASITARRVLLRVWHGLLFWLRNQGITPEVPLQVAFSDARHHAQHWVPKGSDPAGQIIAVVRSGYIRDGALFHRAHVVVTK